MLEKENIYLDLNLKNKNEVFEFLQSKILEENLAHEDYINSIITRDKKASVAIGNYLAIPHSEFEGMDLIKKESIIFIKLANCIKWDENKILFIIALIVKGDSQMDLLQKIALAFQDEKKVKKFYKKINSVDDVLNFIKND